MINDRSTIVEKYAYAVANKQAETINEYVLLYIKKKPWYMPEILYKFILRKVLVLSYFKKHD